MAAAVDLGGELHARVAPPHVESAAALGAVNLVRGERNHVQIVFLHVDRNFSGRLHAVGMEQDALFLGNLADFLDGLDHADFVVGVHDGDQNRFRGDGAAQVVKIDAAVFCNREVGHFVAVLLEAFTGVENGFVFGDLRDDVIALFAVHFRGALEREVIRFRRAAGEDDFLGRRVDQAGDLRARVLHSFLGRPAEGVVAARGVAELLVEVGQHRFDHARVHRSGGVVIHVNWQFNGHSYVSRLEFFQSPDAVSLKSVRGSPGTGVSNSVAGLVVILSEAKNLSVAAQKSKRDSSLRSE